MHKGPDGAAWWDQPITQNLLQQVSNIHFYATRGQVSIQPGVEIVHIHGVHHAQTLHHQCITRHETPIALLITPGETTSTHDCVLFFSLIFPLLGQNPIMITYLFYHHKNT